MNTKSSRSVMCPSAQPEIPGSVAFGVITGSAENPRVAWIERPVPVTSELLALTSPVAPTQVLRIAAPCQEKACCHFDGTDCRLATRLVQLIPAVVESAGGFSPTIGIIGAVMGLIQVMKHLENIEEVGRGIAVAFVATVYGVASANLFFLPVANKIKARFQHAMEAKELMLEGVCSIVEGLNPKLIRVKLDAFVQGQAEPSKKAKAPKQAAQAAVAQG